MSSLVQLQGSPRVRERPLVKPIDEAVWQAWVLTGRAQDRRSSVARIKVGKGGSIAGLLASAGSWSRFLSSE
jgi:hypothetical protein